jgi:hypothetical protein
MVSKEGLEAIRPGDADSALGGNQLLDNWLRWLNCSSRRIVMSESRDLRRTVARRCAFNAIFIGLLFQSKKKKREWYLLCLSYCHPDQGTPGRSRSPQATSSTRDSLLAEAIPAEWRPSSLWYVSTAGQFRKIEVDVSTRRLSKTDRPLLDHYRNEQAVDLRRCAVKRAVEVGSDQVRL